MWGRIPPTHSAILMWNGCCFFFLTSFFFFFLCLSLIPPCNLMTWIKKINFRAVSDLSCECVPLVRLRRGGKKNGKWWRFVSTDQEHIRWILLDYFRIKHFKYFHKYSFLLVLKLNAWLLFNRGNMEDFCSCNVRGALEMFLLSSAKIKMNKNSITTK